MLRDTENEIETRNKVFQQQQIQQRKKEKNQEKNRKIRWDFKKKIVSASVECLIGQGADGILVKRPGDSKDSNGILA